MGMLDDIENVLLSVICMMLILFMIVEYILIRKE